MPPITQTPRPPSRILIVDDDSYIRENLDLVLRKEGYETCEAQDGKTAVDALTRTPIELVVLDLHLPRLSGMEVLRYVGVHFPNLPVIIISGKGDIPQAVEAIQLGAYDFIEKPVHVPRMLVTIRNALDKATVVQQRDRLLNEVRERFDMIGVSSAMQKVYRLVDRAARTAIRVLVTGENGTGKELVARAIQRNSSRAEAPFVAVNCAAIPEALIESELFGHEKGAFTGALGARQGKFEQADGGTLFLDEVGDMSLMTQARVLRVLEEGVITRLGGQKKHVLDVRILAATNKDLEEEMANGNFREDLYYRLNVVHVHLPPLRDRWEDIPILAEHFLTRYSEKHHVDGWRFSPSAIERLVDYTWPGNIRQLRNVIERLVVLSDGPIISHADVGAALNLVDDSSSHPHGRLSQEASSLLAARAQFERRYILKSLEVHGWKIQETATTLGISRVQLWKKMKRYQIAKEE